MDKKEIICRVMLKRSGVNPTVDDVMECARILGEYEAGTMSKGELISELSGLDISPDISSVVVGSLIGRGGRERGQARRSVRVAKRVPQEEA